jgi:hypothetical protein
MCSGNVTFIVSETVPMEEVEATLKLARLAVESLYGAGRVALEARYFVKRKLHQVLIDTSTDVGRTLALIVGGYPGMRGRRKARR